MTLPFSAFLLDRDGTVIEDKHYLSDPDGVELLPGVGEALAAVVRKGVRLFLLSNQSGVGRGMFSKEDVLACNERLASLLAPYGVSFIDMLFCPHAPEDRCSCRKPAVGMWQSLESRYDLLPEQCVMIGDKEEDMLFASRAGLACRALVLTGKGAGTAARLGLQTPEQTDVCFTAQPDNPSHPHLLLPDFRCLEHGLTLLRENETLP